MTDRKTSEELLDGAYNIETPDDSVAYYRDFASLYDDSFAAALGYVYPQVIADHFAKTARATDVPVADIGCGTGLVAEALGLPPADIEGFDISPDMLEISRAKRLYGTLHRIDLTQALRPDRRFGAVVSAGTFTHGHLGPEPLENILSMARPGALFVIGVNAQHFDAKGFAPVLERLRRGGQITDFARETVEIFSRKDTNHGKDEAQILTFRAI